MAEYMVKINSIPGESELAGYEEQIECGSMHHAIDLPVVATGATRTEGASRHGAIELTHSIDKATPLLRHAASAGTNLGQVVITRMRMIGGSSKLAETITLANTYVVRVDTDTTLDAAQQRPAEEPTEAFSLDYSEIKWETKWYVDGLEKATVRGGWSTATQAVV